MFRVLELQKELEDQEEKDKDFLMLQRLAEEEGRCKLQTRLIACMHSRQFVQTLGPSIASAPYRF